MNHPIIPFLSLFVSLFWGTNRFSSHLHGDIPGQLQHIPLAPLKGVEPSPQYSFPLCHQKWVGHSDFALGGLVIICCDLLWFVVQLSVSGKIVAKLPGWFRSQVIQSCPGQTPLQLPGRERFSASVCFNGDNMWQLDPCCGAKATSIRIRSMCWWPSTCLNWVFSTLPGTRCFCYLHPICRWG